eukprot:2331764-Prymnesium_polylepis.1
MTTQDASQHTGNASDLTAGGTRRRGFSARCREPVHFVGPAIFAAYLRFDAGTQRPGAQHQKDIRNLKS